MIGADFSGRGDEGGGVSEGLLGRHGGKERKAECQMLVEVRKVHTGGLRLM